MNIHSRKMATFFAVIFQSIYFIIDFFPQQIIVIFAGGIKKCHYPKDRSNHLAMRRVPATFLKKLKHRANRLVCPLWLFLMARPCRCEKLGLSLNKNACWVHTALKEGTEQEEGGACRLLGESHHLHQ